uniref:Endonuclease/exonuclease/phosphatase family protein n=1 Tax=Pithovirus LCPAC201 TaxID=2506591 RepID=A0A481Z550_9VIRU|nr:MAG: endonuclease/exonuclease/phosphatase family protein [Pithovirus LCPAC201]
MSIIAYGYIIDSTKSDLTALSKYLDIIINSSNQTALVTIKNKYLYTKDSTEITNQRLASIALTLDEVKLLNQLTSMTKNPKLYLFTYHPSSPSLKLRLITFNLGGRVQTNQIKGSEAPLVRLCQEKYSTFKGWSYPRNSSGFTLSQCTLNASMWMNKQGADLIGLQEVSSQYLPLMMEYFPRSHQVVGYATVHFIYNRDKLGQARMLNPTDLAIVQSGRYMLAVWFPKVKLLAVNLHAAHQINLKKEIEKTFRLVKTKFTSPNRIIVTGDFNDAYHSPLQDLVLMGKVLRQHSSPTKSCCTDSNYQYYGDYIFDSDYSSPGFYGISIDARQKLMSDHYPISFYPN